MPNWCEGNIRFRGAVKNIKKFLKRELVACKYGDNFEVIMDKPVIIDDGFSLIITKPDSSWFYINNTHRNFFNDDILEISFDEEDEEKETIICIDGFKTAWSFSNQHNKWKEFAKSYEIDVKMTGYERGALFTQTLTICRDGRIREKNEEYSDRNEWMWDCPEPNKGG